MEKNFETKKALCQIDLFLFGYSVLVSLLFLYQGKSAADYLSFYTGTITIWAQFFLLRKIFGILWGLFSLPNGATLTAFAKKRLFFFFIAKLALWAFLFVVVCANPRAVEQFRFFPFLLGAVGLVVAAMLYGLANFRKERFKERLYART
ncbi:MAG: hypothetical protein AB7F43_02220 [Bacteriovoracia bacterium]